VSGRLSIFVEPYANRPSEISNDRGSADTASNMLHHYERKPKKAPSASKNLIDVSIF
jgi:hypothetical protein